MKKEKRKMSAADRLRKLKIGSMARLITVVTLIVIVLINVAAGIILDMYPVKFDMTTSDFYGIDDSTKEYLRGLSGGIEITLLAEKETYSSQGNYYKQVVETIEEFSSENDKITVNYVNLVNTPGFATNYPNDKLEAGMIIVESEATSRHVVLEQSDYFNQTLDTSTYTYKVTSSKAEAALTAAIINTTNEDPKVLGVISGHGEEDISGLTELLAKNGYTIEKNVTLYTGKLDKDYDGLIISAPVRDYTDEELDVIEKYLSNDENYGKNIFYFASTEQPDLPNLESFLAEWGFEFYDGTVYETDANKCLSVYPYISSLSYADNSFTEGLETSSVALTSPYSRPFVLSYEESGERKTTNYVGFTSSAVVIPNDVNPNNWDSDDAEIKGPFSAVAVSKHLDYTYTDEGQILTNTSNVYVFSSTMFCNEKILQSTVYANGQYVLNLFDDRFNRSPEISLVPKYVASLSMNMSQGEAMAIGIIFAVIIPLAIIITGVVVWLRRRHS